MAWVRLEDNFYDHDKFEQVGPLGIALYVAVLGYCNRNLTDGVVPASKTQRLLDFEGIAVADDVAAQHGESCGDDAGAVAATSLVTAGLWHENDHTCTDCAQPGPRRYVVHDYLRYQPSRERIERERSGSKERMRKTRERRSKTTDSAGGVADGVAAQQGGVLQECSPAPNPNPNPNPKEGSKEPSGPRKRAARLPDIFPITDDMRAWGREKAPDVDAPREHEKFCDYWRGVGKAKVDWVATWRNWMRKAQEDAERHRTATKGDDRPDWMLA